MRLIGTAMLLGIVLAMPAGADERERDPGGAEPPPSVEETVPPARKTVWEVLRQALERLRLSPGHDSLDRSAAANGRQRQ